MGNNKIMFQLKDLPNITAVQPLKNILMKKFPFLLSCILHTHFSSAVLSSFLPIFLRYITKST